MTREQKDTERREEEGQKLVADEEEQTTHVKYDGIPNIGNSCYMFVTLK